MLINIFSDFFDCSVYNRLPQSLLIGKQQKGDTELRFAMTAM